MKVDNIYKLINKYRAEEDQLSAAFGFVLKNNRKLLDLFLIKAGVKISPKDLKRVDIETQVSYDSGKSRIDLQLTIYNNFLIFLESKLYKNEKDIIKQLKKYTELIKRKRREYANKIRLVYVNKYPMSGEAVANIRNKLKLSEKEFYFLSWEDLVKLTDKYNKKETVRLFQEYIGDTMYAKKIINEQKIKDISEVLVIYTNPCFWELSNKKLLAVQRNSTPDARYIAFLRTRCDELPRSAITHIAEVDYTESYVPRKVTYKGFPELIEHTKQRNYDLEGTHKHYVLKGIVELAQRIEHKRGEGTRGQVNFSTTMGELLRAKSVGDLKTARQLKPAHKSRTSRT